jgi:hypothetical protein
MRYSFAHRLDLWAADLDASYRPRERAEHLAVDPAHRISNHQRAGDRFVYLIRADVIARCQAVGCAVRG